MKKLAIAGVIAVAGMLIACGSGSASEDDLNRLNEKAQGDSASVAPSKSVKKNIEAGSWKIGAREDLSAGVITPGTYVIATPENGILCYWQRVKSFDGELTSIIANGNIEPGKDALVTVKKSDKGLVLQHDCLAKKSNP